MTLIHLYYNYFFFHSFVFIYCPQYFNNWACCVCPKAPVVNLNNKPFANRTWHRYFKCWEYLTLHKWKYYWNKYILNFEVCQCCKIRHMIILIIIVAVVSAATAFVVNKRKIKSDFKSVCHRFCRRIQRVCHTLISLIHNHDQPPKS
jgi:hypothetical protein